MNVKWQALRQRWAAADLGPPRAPRYEILTAWRGLACLFVAVYHSVCAGYGLAFPHGPGNLAILLVVIRRLWIGVPIFFVISGYCVTASADAARRRSKPGPRFFWRRFRRIYPPYWVWLSVAGLLIWLEFSIDPAFFQAAFVPDPHAFTGWQWLGNFTLTETWRPHFVRGVQSELLSQSWTLCYEEQFYAVVGVALILAPRFLFKALALVTAAVAALLVFPPVSFSAAGSFLDGRWLMFAAGILVYYALNYMPVRSVGWACVPLGFGILCAAARPEYLLKAKVNEPNQSYLCAFCFALLLMGLRRWDKALTQTRWLRPLNYCGEMCYSLYLVHWPVVTVVSWAFNQLGFRNPFAVFFLGVPSCLAVAIGLARLFHKLVERRFWNPGYASSARSSAKDRKAADVDLDRA